MAKYSLAIKPSATKEIEAISSKKDRSASVAKILLLADNPRPVEATKLANQEKHRIRQGNFRILYQISADIVEVNIVKVGHRRDVYRKKA